jgi:putative oxidoreductase
MSTFFRLAGPPEHMKDWAIALVRLVVGLTFFLHGWQKLFDFGIPGVTQGFTRMGVPMPEITAPLVALVEFVAGASLMIGFLTRLVAIPLAIDMLVAILLVHLRGGFFAPSGVELVLLLFTGAVAMALGGPGALSMDGIFADFRSRAARGDVSATATSPPRPTAGA